LEKLQKTSDDLHRRRKEAKTLEEIAAVNLVAAELLQQLRKVSDAVHAGEMSTQQKTRRQNEANE
jgi:hypothetical protein